MRRAEANTNANEWPPMPTLHIEIRPAEGGEDAERFAGELALAYHRLAARRG